MCDVAVVDDDLVGDVGRVGFGYGDGVGGCCGLRIMTVSCNEACDFSSPFRCNLGASSDRPVIGWEEVVVVSLDRCFGERD